MQAAKGTLASLNLANNDLGPKGAETVASMAKVRPQALLDL